MEGEQLLYRMQDSQQRRHQNKKRVTSQLQKREIRKGRIRAGERGVERFKTPKS